MPSAAVRAGRRAAVATILADHADANKPGPFEERVGVPHRRERFDPADRTGLARPAHKRRSDPRAAVGRVEHDAGQEP